MLAQLVSFIFQFDLFLIKALEQCRIGQCVAECSLFVGGDRHTAGLLEQVPGIFFGEIADGEVVVCGCFSTCEEEICFRTAYRNLLYEWHQLLFNQLVDIV